MAIGDDALASGYSLVPGTGEEGRVRWGAREINRTRDYVAQVKASLAALASSTDALPYTASGSIVATPNYLGLIAIPYGVTFAVPPNPVVSNGDTNASDGWVVGTRATGGFVPGTTYFHAQLSTYTGAPITTSPRRVNWIASGRLA